MVGNRAAIADAAILAPYRILKHDDRTTQAVQT